MEPQQPIPSNYLDQIAPEQPKSPISSRLFGLLIGGGILLIVLVVVSIALAASPKAGISLEQLGLRLQELQKISTDAQKNIKDSQLRAINSRVTTQLTNTNRDIVEPLKAAKIDLKKTSKSLSKSEKTYTEKLVGKLEEARLNNEFDATYSREMSYELDTVTIMMRAIKKKTTSRSLQKFIDESYEAISSLQKELQDYRPA